jgi:hypothetical protein
MDNFFPFEYQSPEERKEYKSLYLEIEHPYYQPMMEEEAEETVNPIIIIQL